MIGAGFTGLSAALACAPRKALVALLTAAGFLRARNRPAPEVEALDPDERRRLAEIMRDP